MGNKTLEKLVARGLNLDPQYVKVVCAVNNFNDLTREVGDLIDLLPNQSQISLTTQNGNADDWISGNGYNSNPENFKVVNSNLKGSTIHQLISQFPEFSRWRIMQSKPKTTLSVHHDGLYNLRVHIPVITNKDAWLVFYESKLKNGYQKVYHAHLPCGYAYFVKTNNFHTAVNYSNTDSRYHIIGEKNETKVC